MLATLARRGMHGQRQRRRHGHGDLVGSGLARRAHVDGGIGLAVGAMVTRSRLSRRARWWRSCRHAGTSRSASAGRRVGRSIHADAMRMGSRSHRSTPISTTSTPAAASASACEIAHSRCRQVPECEQQGDDELQQGARDHGALESDQSAAAGEPRAARRRWRRPCCWRRPDRWRARRRCAATRGS